MTKNGPTPKRVPDRQHRQAEAQQSNENIPDLVWDTDNPLEVNSCSGHSLAHNDTCDGNCPKHPIDEWDLKIENERRAWARLGLQPNADELRKEVQVQTVIEILKDRLGVDAKEFDGYFKPKMFEVMNGLRLANEQAMKSAQIRSRIVLPNMKLQ